MTLIEKAKSIKAVKGNGRVTAERVTLAIAWARGEVNFTQCNKALGLKHGAGTYSLLALCLRTAVEEGKLVLAGKSFRKLGAER